MTWNTDISAAPRGEEKLTTITVDGKQRTKREYHVAPVWLAWSDGSVSRSYWVPETKGGPARWSGCQPTEAPIAWQNFIVPEHPSAETSVKRGAMSIDREAFKKIVEEGRVFVDTNPEAGFLEAAENACPHCGGSGHKDDIAESPQQQGTGGGQIAAVKGKARLANATGVEPSPSEHLYLEDVGSGA